MSLIILIVSQYAATFFLLEFMTYSVVYFLNIKYLIKIAEYVMRNFVKIKVAAY